MSLLDVYNRILERGNTNRQIQRYEQAYAKDRDVKECVDMWLTNAAATTDNNNTDPVTRADVLRRWKFCATAFGSWGVDDDLGP